MSACAKQINTKIVQRYNIFLTYANILTVKLQIVK